MNSYQKEYMDDLKGYLALVLIAIGVGCANGVI